MHFRNNDDLPPDLKTELSPAAQDLYRETFNENFPEDRSEIGYNSEEIAHEAAWRAVQEKFEYIDDKWQ